MANKKKNRTTAEHFRIFVEECEYWIRYFGLIEYRVDFYHNDIDGIGETRVNQNRTDMVATILLGTNWENTAISDYLVRQTGFYEVVELLTWEYGDIVWNKTGKEYERAAAHRLIRRLENSVFKESYNRRFGNVERTSTANTKRKARSRSSKKRS